MKRAKTHNKPQQLTLGTAVPVILEELGVDTVFGIPGNHTAELYRGLAHTGIRHITTRHEQGASFMADGYARVSGKPGVCFLISGPGLLNAATGIVQAQQDCVPLLVVTTCSGAPGSNSALHQMPDQASAAKGLCKNFLSIDTPDFLEETLRQAYALCTNPSPGVVIVQIHTRLLDVRVTRGNRKVAAPPAKKPHRFGPLVSQLTAARKPLVILGGGARWAEDVCTLAERLDAPVLNTVNGKGIVPASHPLSVGGSPSLPCLKRALAQADLVLALGTQFSETDFDLLMNASPNPRGATVYIDTGDVSPAHIDNHYRVPAEEAIPQLLSKLLPQKKRGAARAAGLRQQVQAEPHYHHDFARVFAAIQTAADDLILVGDSTRPTYYAAWMYECEKPGRYFHSASGFGTLGYAIPAAFGASVAADIPVIAMIGDGGAQFTLTELATAVDNKIGVPVIVWRNKGYEEITNSLKARGVGASSTDISAPDYRHIARAYGLKCFSPRTVEGLTRAIRQTLTENRPALILVDQDRFIHSSSGEWYG